VAVAGIGVRRARPEGYSRRDEVTAEPEGHRARLSCLRLATMFNSAYPPIFSPSPSSMKNSKFQPGDRVFLPSTSSCPYYVRKLVAGKILLVQSCHLPDPALALDTERNTQFCTFLIPGGITFTLPADSLCLLLSATDAERNRLESAIFSLASELPY
jgi:hypothetical protein